MRTLDTPIFWVSMAMILGVGAMRDERVEPTSDSVLMDQHAFANPTETAAPRVRIPQARANSTVEDSTSIGSRLTKAEVEQLIKLHNKARSDVDVGPLKWSKKLATYAQAWADQLASAGCKMEHRPRSGKWRQKHGENLFMGTIGFYDVGDAVKMWEEEKPLYKGGPLNSANWHGAGHYTQMVWRDTRQVGCAKVECEGKIIVVCNYDPPGNVTGQKPY